MNGKLRRVLGLGMVSFLTVSALSGCVASGNGGEPSPSMGPSASSESIRSDKMTGSDLKIPDGTLDDLSRAVNGDHKSKPVELNSMRVASNISRVFPIQRPHPDRKPSDHYKLTVACKGTGTLRLESDAAGDGSEVKSNGDDVEWSTLLVCEPDDVIPSTYEISGESTELEVVSGMHSDAAMMFRVDG